MEPRRYVQVVRDGQEVQVPTNSVVRGDIVVLGTGDVVPADMRLAESEDLKVSEMALTGLTIEKKCYIFTPLEL